MLPLHLQGLNRLVISASALQTLQETRGILSMVLVFLETQTLKIYSSCPWKCFERLPSMIREYEEQRRIEQQSMYSESGVGDLNE